MESVIKRKLIILSGLVVVLALMLTAYFGQSGDGEFKGSEDVASSSRKLRSLPLIRHPPLLHHPLLLQKFPQWRPRNM